MVKRNIMMNLGFNIFKNLEKYIYNKSIKNYIIQFE